MAKLAEKPLPPEPPTKDQILERLEHWSAALAAFDSGASNSPVTRREIVVALDRWLDEYLDQKGR
jgi:hypothetical protein